MTSLFRRNSMVSGLFTRAALLRSSGTLAIALLVAASACGKDSTGNTTVASLRFITVPASVVAGETFAVEVELLNPDGERATGSRASVLLTLIGNATLTGEQTVAAAQGLARFEGLGLTTAGSAFILQAEVGTGASAFTAQSSQFAVTPAAASGEQSTAAAPETPLFPFGPGEITFTFRDGFGNLIAGVPVSVTSSLAGSSLNPASGTTNAQGRFVTQFNPGGEGNVTFTATIGGSTFALATTFAAVDLCPPAPMVFPGLTAGAVPAGDCSAAGNPAASHRFTMAQASGVSFTVASAFPPPIIEVQTEPPGSNVRLRSQPTPSEWLLPAGTYRFRIASDGGAGAYTVTSELVPGNTGQVVRALVVAGTYTGQTLEPADFDVYGDGTGSDLYFIGSARPCTITLRSTAFDSYLDVYNAVTQQQVAADDDSGGGLDAQLTLPACSAGNAPLLIVANHWPGPGGPYTLTITFNQPASLHAALMGEAPSQSTQPAVAQSAQRIAAQLKAVRRNK